MAGIKEGHPKADGKKAKKTGRRKWKMSETDRQLIISLAGRGLSEEHIAVHLKVDRTTLRKNAGDLIKEGRSLGVAGVVGVLYKHAMAGSFKHAAYFLNNVDRANWSTTKKVEHSGQLTLEQLVTGEGVDE